MSTDRNTQLELTQRINEVLIGTLNFDELTRKVTRLFIEELNLQGGSVFRIENDGKTLRACSFAIKGDSNRLARVMQKPFNSMATPIDNPENNMGKTAAYGKVYKDQDLSKFVFPVVSKLICKAIIRVSNARFFLSLPIRSGSAIVGALLIGKKDKNFTPKEIQAMEAFTSQLGLAMGNVMAHERILENYRKTLEAGDKPKKNRPRIKFTLRITDDLEQYLNYKTINTKTSKAEYVRKMLEEKMKNDKEYEDFTK
jgi:GAF domain-containing protein